MTSGKDTVESRESSGRRSPCSACGSSDAGFEYDDGHYHCFKCGLHRNADGATARAKKDHRLVDVRPVALTNRALTLETCSKWGYGVGEHRGRPCQVATYYRDGEPVAQKLRFAGKAFEVVGDGKNMPLFGEHLWRDKGRMIVVTEGEVDALSVSQAQGNKWPVVSVPNGAQGAAKSVARRLDWLLGFDVVVFMFDNDEPGRKAAMECAELLPPGCGRVATLPLKDANEMLVAGRAKEIVDAAWGAKEYRPDGILSGEDLWAVLQDEVAVRAAAFPFEALQRRTQGLRLGELAVVVAGTSVGKSTFVRQLAVSIMQQGFKVGYIGLEENVKRSLQGFCSAVVGKPLHLNPTAVDKAAMRAAFDKIAGRLEVYDHKGVGTSDELLRKMRYMATGLGCSVVFLDHISLVAAGFDLAADERRGVDHLLNNLVQITQEAGCAIVAVCHLSRPDKKGKTHEEGRPVSLADIRGSHGIAQMARTVIALERNTQAEGSQRNEARVRVLKCCHTGDTGRAGVITYDNTTGLLSQVGDAEFEEVRDEAADSAY